MYLFSRCRYSSHCAGYSGSKELIAVNLEARRHSSTLLSHAASGSESDQERRVVDVRTRAAGSNYCK